MPSVFISFRHSCFSSSSRLSHRISLGPIWSPQNGWLGLPALSKKGAAETADSPIQAFAPRTCFKALSRRHDGDRYPPASRSSCRLVQGIRQRDTLTTPGRATTTALKLCTAPLYHTLHSILHDTQLHYSTQQVRHHTTSHHSALLNFHTITLH